MRHIKPIKPNNQNKNKQKTAHAYHTLTKLGNLDFENLTNTIHVIWRAFGSEVGTNYLSCLQLQVVFERVGLMPKVAERVAAECFEKLRPVSSCCNLRNQVITFQEFIKLLHGNDKDTDHSPQHIQQVFDMPSTVADRCQLTVQNNKDFLNEFQHAVSAAAVKGNQMHASPFSNNNNIHHTATFKGL